MRVAIPRKEIEGPSVEPGQYHFRIDKVDQKRSRNQNDMLMLQDTIVGSEPPAGAKVFDIIMLQPDGLWRLNLLFQAVRYVPGDDGFDTEDLIGREFRGDVELRDVDGVPRANIVRYHPV